MRSAIKEVSVTINEAEALSILNAIQKGLGSDMHLSEDTGIKGAQQLASILRCTFHSSISGIHTPERL